MYDHGPVPGPRAGREPYAAPEPVAAHFCEAVGARVYCEPHDCPYCEGERGRK